MASNLVLATALEPQVLDALSHFDLPEPTHLQLLTFSENAVFRVEFADQEPVVVRLHSLGYHTQNAIESELQWVEALRADTGVITAGVIPSRRRQTVVSARHPHLPARFAVVFECLQGQEPTGDALPEDFHLLGRTTAVMHQHTRGWVPPSGFCRFRWDVEGTIGGAPHWGDWRENPQLESATVKIVSTAANLVAKRLNMFGQLPTRFGLIHADLRLANLMMNGSTVQVIDFDDCGFGWFLYDLASALTFMETGPQVPALVHAWLEGYREVSALAPSEVMEIPTFLMLRRLVILAWLGSRPDTELVREVGQSYVQGTVELADRYLTLMTTPAGLAKKQIPWV